MHHLPAPKTPLSLAWTMHVVKSTTNEIERAPKYWVPQKPRPASLYFLTISQFMSGKESSVGLIGGPYHDSKFLDGCELGKSQKVQLLLPISGTNVMEEVKVISTPKGHGCPEVRFLWLLSYLYLKIDF